MSLVLPFKTESFTIYGIDDPRTHVVSLAVRVVDEFTEDPVSTPVRVTLSQKTPGGAFEEQTPIRNQRGDFCFEGQAAGNYVLVTEPDPVRDYYFLHPAPAQPWLDTFSLDVALPLLGGPALVVTLAPKPGYPFPSGTTLARGRVVDNAGLGVNRAVVSTSYSQSQPVPVDPDASAIVTVQTRTDRDGYFALFFRSLHVTPHVPTIVQVTAKEGVRQVVQPVQINEREEASFTKLQFP